MYTLAATYTDGISAGTSHPVRTATADEYIKLSVANNSTNKVVFDVVYDGNVILPKQVLNPYGMNTNVGNYAFNLASGKALAIVTYSSDPVVIKADGGNI